MSILKIRGHMYGIIYKITNSTNGRIYIGQTVNALSYRWKQHCKSKKEYPISRAIRKYGKENFSIEEIDSAEDIFELDQKERLWIESLNCIVPNGYNITSGGFSGSKAKRSEETKRKISESKIGLHSGENNPFYGKTHSDEFKGWIGERNKEKKWNLGKKLSLDVRAKLSETRKGKKTGEENPKSKKYLVISPDGINYEFFGGFRMFCKEHEIRHPEGLRDVAKGKKESHNGWKCYYLEKK